LAPTVNTGSGLVQVVPFGANVPNLTVEHTRQLLAHYSIVKWDGNRLQMTLSQPVKIELVEDKANYEKALQSLGVDPGQASSLSQDTGGFTIGDNIVIPMYQNTTDPDLLNSLAHELTHAYINENKLDIPSWINEGLAVDDGMNMQRQSETNVAYMGYARRMAEDVLKAAKQGKLLSLSGDEDTVLSGSATYDVELQDWLAVNMLLQQVGYGPFEKYFSLLKQGESDSAAFADAFGRTDSAVNQSLNRLLTQAANEPDNGVQFALQIPASFNGTVHVLPRNSQTWQGFSAPYGTVQFGLLPDGTLTGIKSATSKNQDAEQADPQTVYLDVEAKGLSYQGQGVASFGYAIDVHYGLYGFINSWISLASGKTIYLSTPDVLGVQLTNVEELGAPSPILTLLQRDPLASG
jgi:hypothetical protein